MTKDPKGSLDKETTTTTTTNAKDTSLEQQIINSVEKTKSEKKSDMPRSNKTVLKASQEEEDGDAYLLIKQLENRYVYDHMEKNWYYWNDNFWRLDGIGHVITLIKEVIDLYGQQLVFENLSIQAAEKEEDSKAVSRHKYNSKMLAERINGLRKLTRKEKVLKLSRSGLKSLGIMGTEWDTKPMLLAVRNGCINLKEGTFKPGEPKDYLRLSSPIEWKGEDEDCSALKSFLLQIFDNDQDMVDYIQRLLGYGITGLTTEHIFPIFWGPKGRNGKSTLFEILKFILDDLMFKAPSNFLMETKLNNSGTAPDAVMMNFRGRRIVWFSETNKNDRIDVAKLKELSGGDTISTRGHYAKKQTQFQQTQLTITITNKRPKMPADDPAVWFRTHLIPLDMQFLPNPDPKNKKQLPVDKNLLPKLKKQAPGILAWLVEGCLLWQELGLLPPDKVLVATKEYQKSQDIFGHYIDECLLIGDHVLRVDLKALYINYKEWCNDVGHYCMAKDKVLLEMEQRFSKRVSTNGKKFFRGVTIFDHPIC